MNNWRFFSSRCETISGMYLPQNENFLRRKFSFVRMIIEKYVIKLDGGRVKALQE